MTKKFHTCLLIDDNPLDNFVNTRTIRKVNFADEILVSERPLEALQLLKKGEIHPEVIFLDIHMPLMDGFDFLREYDNLKINKDKTTIVVLSSTLNEEDKRRAESNKYVSKFLNKFLTQEMLLDLAN